MVALPVPPSPKNRLTTAEYVVELHLMLALMVMVMAAKHVRTEEGEGDV